MPRQVRRHVRGSAAQNAAYTGPLGEPVMTSDTREVFVHDGETPGGVRQINEKSKLAGAFAGALPVALTALLFTTVHATHFGVQAIAADAPVEQRVSQTAKLRGAIAFAEARGAHLVLPDGDIWFGPSPDDTEACLRISRAMGMSGACWGTRLMPLPNVTGRHLLMVKPLANTPMQGAFLRNFSIGAVGAGHAGLNALRIDTTNPGGYIAGLIVDSLAMGPGGPDNRAFEHFNTDAANKNGGMFASTFYDCTVVGGMKFTKTGDSNNILQCRISNYGIGIDYDTTSGAAMHCIERCNITSQGGAIRFNGVLQGHVRFNQIEQSFPYTGNANDNACITVINSTQCTFEGNNINTHGRVDVFNFKGSPNNSIYPNTVCYGDGNVVLRALGSPRLRFDIQVIDIIFAEGQDNNGQQRDFPLTFIDASSSPVVGVPMPQTLKGGFTDAGGANFNTGLRACLMTNKRVQLSGNLNGGLANDGTRKQGTPVATLPVSMRPKKAQYLPVIVNQPGVGFVNGMLLIDVVGGISVVTMPPGQFGVDTLSFQLN
jgi:Major tropism determinant N-terminal domain